MITLCSMYGFRVLVYAYIFVSSGRVYKIFFLMKPRNFWYTYLLPPPPTYDQISTYILV